LTILLSVSALCAVENQNYSPYFGINTFPGVNITPERRQSNRKTQKGCVFSANGPAGSGFVLRRAACQENLLFFFRFLKAGFHLKAFFGAALNTAPAEDTAELFKAPLFGGAADRDRIGRTFFCTQTAIDTLFRINDQFPPFAGKGRTLFKRIVAGDRAFDQIAQNIFEYGK
jgi:hypothetical protein